MDKFIKCLMDRVVTILGLRKLICLSFVALANHVILVTVGMAAAWIQYRTIIVFIL